LLLEKKNQFKSAKQQSKLVVGLALFLKNSNPEKKEK